MKVDFYRHNVGEQEIESVAQTMQSIFLTTGPKTSEFEKKFAGYMGVAYAVGVSSWTMGCIITLKALGVGEGDEVITTPMTFIATANAICHVGATPVFVDVEPDTGNMDAEKIEEAITPKTKAIIPVHLYGQMCDMNRISEIADRHNLHVIEDCAHCIEGARDGIGPGQKSSAAIFSFYATKNLTCGEGGAIITNNQKLKDDLCKYRLHGMNKGAADRYTASYKHWDMDLLGLKCNMMDMQAAMLIPQLDRIEEILERKSEIASRYEKAFAQLPGIDFPKVLPASKHARHLFTIWVDKEKRDGMLQKLQDAEIGVAVNFRAIHLLTYYKKTFGYEAGSYPIAERIGDSTITLPLYAKMSDQQVDYVIEQVGLL